ncbi:MAG: hypothetical protein SF051_04200, partial [Elusimicrobiota bacterium]|nr:hypothetical protein [Elusimicrobiota bacterium]
MKTWPSAERRAGPLVALLLASLAAPGARASGAVLYFADDHERVHAALVLEQGLVDAGGAGLLPVLPYPLPVDLALLKSALTASAARVAVAAPGQPAPAAAVLRAARVEAVVRSSATARVLLAMAGASAVETATARRDAARRHFEFGDDTGALQHLLKALDLADAAPEDAAMLERLIRVTDEPWRALLAADRIARSPALDAGARA